MYCGLVEIIDCFLLLFLTAVRDEHILSSLEEVKCEMRTLSRLVHSLVQNETCDLPEGVELPLKSMEELDRMEGLLDDERVKKQMVGMICSIPGILVLCALP